MFDSLQRTVFLSLLSLGLISCGTMHNPDNLSEVPEEVSQLAHSLRLYQRSLPSLPEPSNIIPIEDEVKSCSEGGSMHFTNDYNQSDIIQNIDNFTLNLTSQAEDCIEEGITVDGDMQIKIVSVNNLATSTITFMTDFIISEDMIQQLLIKKESFSVTQAIDDNTNIITDSSEILALDSTQKTFFYKTQEFSKNNMTEITNISGKKVVDGKTFIIDESFDHASTPMVYDEDENLQIGGKQRYKNEEEHAILMEAIDINQIRISIDENGDGTADNIETVITL